jgi:hypothetical protein
VVFLKDAEQWLDRQRVKKSSSIATTTDYLSPATMAQARKGCTPHEWHHPAAQFTTDSNPDEDRS